MELRRHDPTMNETGHDTGHETDRGHSTRTETKGTQWRLQHHITMMEDLDTAGFPRETKQLNWKKEKRFAFCILNIDVCFGLKGKDKERRAKSHTATRETVVSQGKIQRIHDLSILPKHGERLEQGLEPGSGPVATKQSDDGR